MSRRPPQTSVGQGPRTTPRAGLATLEMVLSLPILLFLMALMINFGNLASWKVRAANVARDEAWTARWPHDGVTPWQVGWPNSAGRGVAAAGSLPLLYDPSIDQPVVRGPMLGQTKVHRDLLDPTRGLVQGTSSIQPELPLLPKLGKHSFNLQHLLLDDGWQYPRMGMSSNRQRREPIIYDLAKADPSVVQNYVQAVMAVYFAPFQPQLAVLDRDAEIFAFYQSYHDFHPRLGGFCSLNKKTIHDQYVLPLIDRIQGRKKPKVQGVPETMTRFFLAMYQAELALLKAQMPGLPPDEQAAAAAKLGQIQNYISQLTAFLGQVQ